MMRAYIGPTLLVLLLAACNEVTAPEEAPGGELPAAKLAGSPGQGRIAFASAESGNWDIWVINPNGTGRTRLTNHAAADQEPAWCGNQRIAFRSNRQGSGKSDLYRMNPDGTGQTPMITSLWGPLLFETAPAWSPDCSKVAFVSGWDIWVMNANGTAVTNLTNDGAFQNDPTWSADGSTIAFWSTESGPAEIYTIKADGSARTQVTFYNTLGGTAIHPQWSPDGQWIAFTWYGPVDFGEIFIVKPDGTQLTQLTSSPTTDENQPTWSPDSKRIAFLRNGDIWIMKRDGTGVTNVTNSATAEDAPAWSR